MVRLVVVLAILLNHIPLAWTACETQAPSPYLPSDVEQERDNIYMLLAYAVVFKGWQIDNRRGYNIGSVLVDPGEVPQHQLVCWGRNAVGVTRNTTQHGEVRVLTNYLHQAEARQVPGLKLYTTLEPCAMCAGMMSLTGVRTTVYGQSDPHFGGALQRLAGDPHQQKDERCPHPRGVQAVASTVSIRAQLDEAYEEAGKPSITDWLAGNEAQLLFSQAHGQLDSYEVRFQANAEVLERAHSFLESVPAEYVRAPYGVACEEPMIQKAGWIERLMVSVRKLVRGFVE